MSPYSHRMDHRQIISLWPSARALALDMRAKPETVKKWNTRNWIPADHWASILVIAKKKRMGITFELLASHKKRAT